MGQITGNDVRGDTYCISIKRPGPMNNSLFTILTLIFSY